MKRETWNDLAVLAAVDEARSFTAAARSLGISPSAVSHIVKGLEERLGMRLLHRSTRSVAPTEAGAQLLAALGPARANLDAVLGTLGEQKDRPAGRVRITSHRMAAQYALLPKMPKFGRDFPEVAVEISVDDSLVDFISAGYDAGVRPSEVLDPDMIAVRIDQGARLAYVAAPSYLAEAGEPEAPGDLLRHRCVNYRFGRSGELYRWPFDLAGEQMLVDVPSQLVFNDSNMLLSAAVEGCGIACLTEDQALGHIAAGRLVRLFEGQSPQLPANYLYYSGRRLVPPPLRAFLDFIKTGGART
jgi:DNA-binding transcriptional LysR family regulator